MKIGNNPDIAKALAQAAAKQQTKAQAAPAPAAQAEVQNTSRAAAGVPVTLSSTAREVGATTRSTAEFDAGKVKAIKNAIDNGTFKVNADAVADKLLANAYETLSRSRG